MEPVSLLTPEDLARLLKVSKRTILRWLAAGRLPEPIRCTNRSLRWPADVVLRWLDEQCRQFRRYEQ